MRQLVLVLAMMVLVASPTRVAAQEATKALETPSDGLGISGAQWIETFGEPIDSDLPDPFMSFGSDELRIDVPIFEKDRPVTGFTIRFQEAIPLSDAQKITEVVTPKDSNPIEVYPAPVSESRVELYHSDWLAEEVQPTADMVELGLDHWRNAEPGDFIAIYGWEDDDPGSEMVNRIIVATGNNP